MKRKLSWIVWNTGMALAVYFGACKGVAWAGNMVFFVIWLELPLHFVAFANNEIRSKLKSGGRPVPEWASCSLRLALILGLAAAGWFFTAAAYAVSSLCVQAIHGYDPAAAKQDNPT